MTKNSTQQALQHRPPPFRLLAREGMSFAYMRMTATFGSAVNVTTKGSGQNVVVIPGFMASDRTTARLRRSLTAAGFGAHGWGLGRNTGIKSDIIGRLLKWIDQAELNEPITLVGWSLGGLIAREFAKHHPHRIAKVITMGSPFSGNPRANNAWRVYELVAGHKVNNPPIKAALNEKPPVPTIAFWSANDGVISSGSACGQQGESDRQIELDCRHMAFVSRADAIAAIAAEIAS